MKFDEKIQLIIVGESSVRKTSFLYKNTQCVFTHQHLATADRINIYFEYFT
jgi:hypothetical protein